MKSQSGSPQCPLTVSALAKGMSSTSGDNMDCEDEEKLDGLSWRSGVHKPGEIASQLVPYKGENKVICIPVVVAVMTFQLQNYIDVRVMDILSCQETSLAFLTKTEDEARPYFKQAAKYFLQAVDEDPTNEVYLKSLEISSKRSTLCSFLTTIISGAVVAFYMYKLLSKDKPRLEPGTGN